MTDKNKLTHFNEQGNVHMVDVGEKEITARKAIAEGRISMMSQTLAMIGSGKHKKGDVLSIARVAAIMAAKRTSDLIPLCHPIMLTRVNVDLSIDEETDSVYCQATTQTVNGPEWRWKH